MRKILITLSAVSCVYTGFAQLPSHGGVVRKLEPCECQVKTDSGYKTQCAYMLVPENRLKNNGRMIKVPFIRVFSSNPAKRKDPLLFTAGGPGSTSLGWAGGVSKSAEVMTEWDCIAFEQRGTYYAVPRLFGGELDSAIKESYRRNLNRDSMMIVGTQWYRKAMEARGIDLSGYNTDETVADIADLMATLQIDSVNLLGGSYSGGLMMAVLQNDPSRVRSMVLNSPLPTFVPIDEDEPMNFMESMDIVFDRVSRDSVSPRYSNLKEQFVAYFNQIRNKKFFIRYTEKGRLKSENIAYDKNDLLDIISGNIYHDGIKDIAGMVADIIEGKHEPYMRSKLDGIFGGSNGPSAMRISAYCADQTAYHDEKIMRSAYSVYPFLEGFHINDVYREMCDCWNVPPIRKETKQAFYSPKPALVSDGLLDNACRPLYIDRIKHYLPNAQRIVLTDYAHSVGGEYYDKIVMDFLKHPYKKIVSDQKNVISY